MKHALVQGVRARQKAFLEGKFRRESFRTTAEMMALWYRLAYISCVLPSEEIQAYCSMDNVGKTPKTTLVLV